MLGSIVNDSPSDIFNFFMKISSASVNSHVGITLLSLVMKCIGRTFGCMLFGLDVHGAKIVMNPKLLSKACK